MFLKKPFSKFAICAIVWTTFTLTAIAQVMVQDPPSIVESAFKTQYPSVHSVKWAKSDASYIAEFKEKDAHVKALYDSAGNFIESEQAIEVSELPENVVLYIMTQDETAKILKAYKIVRAGQRKELYDVVAKIHYKKSRITVSRDGYLTSH